MYFNILGSGSKGNATLLVSGDNVLLIDFGLTKERLLNGLKEINKDISDIDALLISHEHSDHLNGLKCLSPSKIYGTHGTVPSSLNKEIEYFSPFRIGVFEIVAFPICHDAKKPAGFVINDGKDKFIYLTDTGSFGNDFISLLENPTYLYIESNHDIEMLLKTNRPLVLKQRILSEHGHLCNEDSAFLAASIIGDHTKEIILAHISEEANTPEKAIEAYRSVFKYNISKFKIYCAPQWTSLLGGETNEN